MKQPRSIGRRAFHVVGAEVKSTQRPDFHGPKSAAGNANRLLRPVQHSEFKLVCASEQS